MCKAQADTISPKAHSLRCKNTRCLEVVAGDVGLAPCGLNLWLLVGRTLHPMTMRRMYEEYFGSRCECGVLEQDRRSARSMHNQGRTLAQSPSPSPSPSHSKSDGSLLLMDNWRSHPKRKWAFFCSQVCLIAIILLRFIAITLL